MNRSTKRFVLFLGLFIFFLHTYMFPACCFPQRTYVAKGLMNRTSNETRTNEPTRVSSNLIKCLIHMVSYHILTLTKAASWEHTRM